MKSKKSGSKSADTDQNPPAQQLIRQKLLKESRRLKPMVKRYGKVQAQIRQLWNAGAAVEPGRLGIDIKTRRKLSIADLVDLFQGDDESLKKIFSKVVYKVLVIVDRDAEDRRVRLEDIDPWTGYPITGY
jgi:hypothetical protein